MEKLSRTRTAWLIVFLVTIWGVNWPLSKIALSYTPPVLFSGMRTLLGGLLLLIVALPRYQQLRFKKTWYIYVLSSILNIILYYGLQTIGLSYMAAGLFAAIVFLQPVLIGLFSWLWFGEAMHGLKVVGLLMGFSGVAVISAGGLSGHISPIGILLALGSALSWAFGTLYVKKIGTLVDPIWLVTVQLIMGGLFMTGAGSVVESWSSIVWSWPYIASLLFISVFVIAIGWIVFYKLMSSGEAGEVASFTFLIPLIAIVIGTLFLHEPFTFSLLMGLVLIITSIYLVNRKPRWVEAQAAK